LKGCEGLRRHESAATRADAVRRALSREIVRTGTFRPDALEIKVSVSKQNGGYVRETVERRVPTDADLVRIRQLAHVWAHLAERLDDHPKNFDFFNSLMRSNRGLGDGEAEAASKREFLATDGWHIESGPTGRPSGRWHLATEKRTRACLEEIAPLLEAHRAIRAGKHRNAEQKRLYRLVANTLKTRGLSPRHAARSLSVSERTLFEMKKLGQADDSTGETEVQEVIAEIRALRSELRETREDHAETRRLVRENVELLRQRFPTNEEVSAEIDRFLASLSD